MGNLALRRAFQPLDNISATAKLSTIDAAIDAAIAAARSK